SVAAKTPQRIHAATNRIGSFICRFVPLRNARQRSIARIAYSLMCPSLRTKKWTCANAPVEMSGFNQRKNGTRKREVCSADIRSVEPTKMTQSQISSGSQYLRKNRIVVGAPASDANLTYPVACRLAETAYNLIRPICNLQFAICNEISPNFLAHFHGTYLGWPTFGNQLREKIAGK